MIQVRDLAFRFPAGGFSLEIPRLEIRAGSPVALAGPSGSGKSTLLRLLVGILRPERGEIDVDGRSLHRLGESARRDFRIQRVGFVFQDFRLLEYLTVLDNVLLPYRINASLRLDGTVVERAQRLLQSTGLAGFEKRPIGRLSQGERQRVAVCRALVTQPALLVADEPTGNLDAASAAATMDILFSQARDAGATLLVVTHDPAMLGRFGQVLRMDGGRIA